MENFNQSENQAFESFNELSELQLAQFTRSLKEAHDSGLVTEDEYNLFIESPERFFESLNVEISSQGSTLVFKLTSQSENGGDIDNPENTVFEITV